ncbi:MAG: ABC transporter substrate-binding protein [Clostridiales bacterium]|nr:ABC transporter substrate-binding protein [Clostridiales bacterium]MDO4351386.1 ABC transporter substrate-binding protein [Eubacteriales bacterium]MDY4009366.1 ABC transporter substrate-binding protein [Candidatus Limiplasma sp.]
MKKFLSLLLALCMLAGLCGTALADETITLDFWVRTSDDFSAEIAAFEAANPGIKINQVQVGGNYDDLVAKYNAAIAAGNLPHVGIVGQRHGIPQFYDAGKLIPIENYMTAEEQADVIDGFWTRYTYQGVRLAVPFQSSMPMMYYNETMLNELGLEVPTTFTGMIEAAKQAVKDLDGDGATDIYGFNMHSDSPWYIQPLVWSFGGTIIDADGNVNVNTPEMKEVFSLIAGMVKDGVMPANQHATAQTDFTNGTTLFFFTSCASKSNIQEAIGDSFQYNMAFFPAEKELNVCIGGNGLAIFASDDAHQEAAAKFIKYMISPESISQSTLQRGYMPFTHSQFASELIQARLEDPIWKTVLAQVDYIQGQNIHPADSTIWNETMALLSEIEADPDMDIGAALEKMQAEIDEFMMLY